MSKRILLCVVTLFSFLTLFAQTEKPPVYPGCENETLQNLNSCFTSKVKKDILDEFKVPAQVERDSFQGRINVQFMVTREGKFDVLYVNTVYQELTDEVHRVFKTLPQVQPYTYNGRAIDQRYQVPIAIPLENNLMTQATVQDKGQKEEIEERMFDSDDTLFPEFQSELNIPFIHQEYDDIIYHMNMAENTHTTAKPFLFNEVRPYIDLEAKRNRTLKDKESWGGRKLWNEHLALIKGDNYWFTLNPVFDLQVGTDNSDVDYTYNNTRGIQIQGSLGKKFSFSTSFYESQGRFADYINDYARAKRPTNENSYGLVPGRGKAKQHNDDAFDYPVAEAYLSFTPNEFFNFQFGQGKNFFGDGYRSFFLSDVATNYPFLKIQTTFWKIKYTNLWAWMDDVRGEVSDSSNLRKYVAMHHLSWNVTKRFNIGFFEMVVTSELSSPNGFDIAFFNPIIFYRAIEFSGNSESGNANIGMNMKYRFKGDQVELYTQFLIDEMTTSRVFDGTGYWGNKFSFQLGGKYYKAFNVDGLTLQGEFNWSRPYTYAHRDVDLNAGHYNEPLTHLWGANFWEVIGIARYNQKRWFGNAKLIVGKKGFDFEDSDLSYGGNIYLSYNDRVSDEGNEVAQGNTTDIVIADLQAGYVLNPVTNTQIFAGFTFRNFSPTVSGDVISENDTTWITIGLRASLFNWYFDF